MSGTLANSFYAPPWPASVKYSLETVVKFSLLLSPGVLICSLVLKHETVYIFIASDDPVLPWELPLTDQHRWLPTSYHEITVDDCGDESRIRQIPAVVSVGQERKSSYL